MLLYCMFYYYSDYCYYYYFRTRRVRIPLSKGIMKGLILPFARYASPKNLNPFCQEMLSVGFAEVLNLR